MSDQAAADEEALHKEHEFYERHRRRRLASMFELFIYVLAVSGAIARAYVLMGAGPVYVITDSAVVFTTFLLVISVFFLLLTGSTPLVALFQKGSLQSFLNPMTGISDLLEIAAARTASKAIVGADLVPGDIVRKISKSQLIPPDKAEQTFLAYLARSQTAADNARRSPTALLLAGTFIALLGLVFFILTLPGSRYGLFLPSDQTPSTQDIWSTFIQLLPRLLMLIFIQVLAGFFLRQYRLAMEDFRYYESILRHREAQYLSFTLRKSEGDQEALIEFAREIMKDQQYGVLGKGQTTAALEAMKAERNDFAGMYEKIAGLVAEGKKAATPKKAKAAKTEEPKAE